MLCNQQERYLFITNTSFSVLSWLNHLNFRVMAFETRLIIQMRDAHNTKAITLDWDGGLRYMPHENPLKVMGSMQAVALRLSSDEEWNVQTFLNDQWQGLVKRFALVEAGNYQRYESLEMSHLDEYDDPEKYERIKGDYTPDWFPTAAPDVKGKLTRLKLVEGERAFVLNLVNFTDSEISDLAKIIECELLLEAEVLT